MTAGSDDRLRAFLADEGRRASQTAPSLEEAIGRLAPRLLPRAQQTQRRLVVLLAAALLTAAALGSAIAVGSGRLSLPLIVEVPSNSNGPVFQVAVHYYDTGGVPIGIPERTRVHAQLPDGWTATAEGITNDPAEPEPAVAVSFWAVDAVFINPCDPVGPHGADPPMMRSLDGLVTAFTAWWQGAASDLGAGAPAAVLPRSTDAVATAVSGWRARYLEIRIPNTEEVAACDRYVTWRNAEGIERRHGPGDVSRVWVVEVGPPRGRRGEFYFSSTPLLVIDASSSGDPSSDALAELEELVDSLAIEAPPEMTP